MIKERLDLCPTVQYIEYRFLLSYTGNSSSDFKSCISLVKPWLSASLLQFSCFSYVFLTEGFTDGGIYSHHSKQRLAEQKPLNEESGEYESIVLCQAVINMMLLLL